MNYINLEKYFLGIFFSQYYEKENSMFYMTIMWYPNDKSNEVATKYLEGLEKNPFDENLGEQIIPAGIRPMKKGIETIAITKVNDGKLEELVRYTSKLMVEFRHIDGFRYENRLYRSVEEALELIGMGS